MTDDIHHYEPSKGHGLPHDPFNAMVGPRPIGWISTQDSAGNLNLAPYSFFNAFIFMFGRRQERGLLIAQGPSIGA